MLQITSCYRNINLFCTDLQALECGFAVASQDEDRWWVQIPQIKSWRSSARLQAHCMYFGSVSALKPGWFLSCRTPPCLEGWTHVYFSPHRLMHLVIVFWPSRWQVRAWYRDAKIIWFPEQVILANGKEYVLAGSLDLNQGIVLPGETVRKKTQVVSFNSFLAKRSSPLTFPAPPIKIQVISCSSLASILVKLRFTTLVVTLVVCKWASTLFRNSSADSLAWVFCALHVACLWLPAILLSVGDSLQMQSPAPERGRGYISNVCVAPSLRQRGVGKALLQQAQNVAHSWGLHDWTFHSLLSKSCFFLALGHSHVHLMTNQVLLDLCFRYK